LRNKEGLTAVIKKLPELKEEYENDMRLRDTSLRFNSELLEGIELSHMIKSAEIIARAALLRAGGSGGAIIGRTFPNQTIRTGSRMSQ
jgi:succinate dehydrogenase/fumarate reductase flavoprotein subunit